MTIDAIIRRIRLFFSWVHTDPMDARPTKPFCSHDILTHSAKISCLVRKGLNRLRQGFRLRSMTSRTVFESRAIWLLQSSWNLGLNQLSWFRIQLKTNPQLYRSTINQNKKLLLAIHYGTIRWKRKSGF